MIGIQAIHVRLQENSKKSLWEIKEILKKSLEKHASSTKFDIWNDGEKVTVMFMNRQISLQTVNKIMHDLQTKRIVVKKFSWEEHEDRPIKIGSMEIIIS